MRTNRKKGKRSGDKRLLIGGAARLRGGGMGGGELGGALTTPNAVLILLLVPNKPVSVCIVQHGRQGSKAGRNAETS